MESGIPDHGAGAIRPETSEPRCGQAMNVLFVHQNFPAQFGHLARHLVARLGWKCTFVSQTSPGEAAGVRKIEYRTRGGAQASTHYCSRTFENSVWHAHGVFEACKAAPDIR